jgi:response regulator RpfG family c-di-GMP phosphodiesterase
MTHTRPYQAAIRVEAAVDMIAELRGRYYDPAVVDAFIDAWRLHQLPEVLVASPTR